MAKTKKVAASAAVDEMNLPPEVLGDSTEPAAEPAAVGEVDDAKLAKLTTPINAGVDGEALEKLRQRIKDLRTQIEEGYWELAVDLAKVYGETLYVEWGFENWSDYVEKELDFKLRTAQYMVSIAEWFGKMEPDVQTWVKSLGWTKAKELVGKVDESNWSAWKKKIAGKSVSAIMDMMASEKKGKSKDVDTLEEFKRRAFKLAPAQIENVEKAIAKAKDDAKTDSDAHALDLVCTEFLATHQGQEGLSDYLANLEKIFGVSLVAYNKTTDSVVYGAALLESFGSAGS
jgi:hypothetical protein